MMSQPKLTATVAIYCDYTNMFDTKLHIRSILCKCIHTYIRCTFKLYRMYRTDRQRRLQQCCCICYSIYVGAYMRALTRTTMLQWQSIRCALNCNLSERQITLNKFQETNTRVRRIKLATYIHTQIDIGGKFVEEIIEIRSYNTTLPSSLHFPRIFFPFLNIYREQIELNELLRKHKYGGLTCYVLDCMIIISRGQCKCLNSLAVINELSICQLGIRSVFPYIY